MAGLLPLADAGAEGRALDTPAHIGGAGDEDCGAEHHDVFCQVLNATREPFLASGPADGLVLAASPARSEDPERVDVRAGSAGSAPAVARAPPVS